MVFKKEVFDTREPMITGGLGGIGFGGGGSYVSISTTVAISLSSTSKDEVREELGNERFSACILTEPPFFHSAVRRLSCVCENASRRVSENCERFGKEKTVLESFLKAPSSTFSSLRNLV